MRLGFLDIVIPEAKTLLTSTDNYPVNGICTPNQTPQTWVACPPHCADDVKEKPTTAIKVNINFFIISKIFA